MTAKAPLVLTSSLDNAPVPPIRGATKLAELAHAHGWVAKVTYALAAVPDRYFDNGNLAKAAHQLASVAVRLSRGPERGWATWHSEDAQGWRFDSAYVGLERFGWATRSKLTSILERITQA